MPGEVPPPPPVAERRIVAAGDGWALVGDAAGVTLLEAGRAIAQGTAMRRRFDVQGTMLGWSAPSGGMLTMLVGFGRCRLPGGRDASYFALLRWRGRSFRGCYVGALGRGGRVAGTAPYPASVTFGPPR